METDDHLYNISDEVTQICQKLGLYPYHVLRLDVYPNKLVAEIVEVDEAGHKRVNAFEGVDTRTVVYRVRT